VLRGGATPSGALQEAAERIGKHDDNARHAESVDYDAATQALEQLELAVKWGATLPEVYANLSFARLATGDATGALAAADVGIRIDEKHVPSHYNRAAALNALNQLVPCLATLDEILKLAPGFAPAVQSRANTLKKMGRA
jgi:tetratricopeptide (TPR) repeat protein